MKTFCEENKGNKGLGVSMFNYSVPEWNSFSATSDKTIKKGSIREVIKKVVERNNIN
jgi:hypothetical protein